MHDRCNCLCINILTQPCTHSLDKFLGRNFIWLIVELPTVCESVWKSNIVVCAKAKSLPFHALCETFARRISFHLMEVNA